LVEEQVQWLLASGLRNPFLFYILASPNYQLTVVANSTVASAQASIDYHNLGAGIKAYGSPEEIANDPNVDLVAVSVNVGKHCFLAKPALLAGKNIFVEWSLGASTKKQRN
jgi:predicted dehydrogenase